MPLQRALDGLVRLPATHVVLDGPVGLPELHLGGVVGRAMQVALGRAVYFFEVAVGGEVGAVVGELRGQLRQVDPHVLLVLFDELFHLDRDFFADGFVVALGRQGLGGDVGLFVDKVQSLHRYLFVLLLRRLLLVFDIGHAALRVDLVERSLIELEGGLADKGVVLVVEESLLDFAVVALGLDLLREVVLVDLVLLVEGVAFGGDLLEEVFVLVGVEEGQDCVQRGQHDHIDAFVEDLLRAVDVFKCHGRSENGCAGVHDAEEGEDVENFEVVHAVELGRKDLKSKQFAEKDVSDFVVDRQGHHAHQAVETSVEPRLPAPALELALVAQEDRLREAGDHVQDVEIAQGAQSDVERDGFARVVPQVIEVEEIQQGQHLKHPHERIDGTREVSLAELQSAHQARDHQHCACD